MNYLILKKSSETQQYINDVIESADKCNNSLGFFAASVYDQFVNKDSLWILTINKEYAGHIMFSVSWSKLKITINQTFVKDKFRKNGYAKALVKELKAWGESHNLIHIRANVADDLLEANSFYNSLGFEAITQKDGGKTKNRKINTRVLNLNTPTLLRFGEECRNVSFVSSCPINNNYRYCLDINILNDFTQNREHRGCIEKIIKGSLSGNFEICISPEAHKEINRSSYSKENDPLYELAKNIPTLAKVNKDDIEQLFPCLEKLIFGVIDKESKQKEHMVSDIFHLVYSILSGCSGFITRDKKLLRASKKVFGDYKVEILSPEEFVYTEIVEDFEHKIILETTTDTMEIEKITEKDFNILNNYLEKLDIERGQIALSKYQGVNVKIKAENVAMIIWSLPHKKEEHIISYVLYDESRSESIIFDHLIETLFRSLRKDNASYLTLFTQKTDVEIKNILIKRGFSVTSSLGFVQYSRFICEKLLGDFNWEKFCEKFKESTGKKINSKLPSYKKLKTNGIMIGEHSAYCDFFDFETKISPSIIVPEGREVKIIPIRPEYAKELIGGSSEKMPTLFNFAKKPAFIKIEKAYFKNPNVGAKVNKGDLIMFYESSPASSLIGVARCTYSSVLSVLEAKNMLKRQGVLCDNKLEEISINGNVHALTFDNFHGFLKEIPFKKLEKMGIGKNKFISVNKTTSKVFLDLCKLGGIYEN